MTNYEVLIKLLEVYFPRIKNNIRDREHFIFGYRDFNFENREDYQAWLNEEYNDADKPEGFRSTLPHLTNYDIIRDLFFLYFPDRKFNIKPRRACFFWKDICNGTCVNCPGYGEAIYEIPEELIER